MNFGGVCGLIDIILVVGILLFLLIGAKKGFSKKLLSPITILIFLGVSIVFCGSVAGLIMNTGAKDLIYNPILESLEGATGDSYSEILQSKLEMWNVIADQIGKLITSATTTFEAAEDPIANIALYLTQMAYSGISCICLFLVMIIIASILRAIGRSGENVGFIRFVDGLLGAVFYVAIFSVIVCCVFYLLGLMMDQSWFASATDWVKEDMQLETDAFRISKIIYNGNFLQKILNMFF